MIRCWTTLALLTASAASAATLSGRVTNGSTGVSSGEVRLWGKSGKWFAISQTTNTDGSGNYNFAGIAQGDWLVDARPCCGFGDRWYDTDGNGYIAADADVITLTAAQNKTGVDIVVQGSGGVDGTARKGTSLSSGLEVRCEMVSEARVHHNEDSMLPPHQGEFHMRGLPPGQYRMVVHDQNDQFADAVSISPFTIAATLNASAGQLDLAPAPTDLGEPNNTRATATPFTATRTVPYNTPANTRIGPRMTGDVDWYCTNAARGERFIAHAEAFIDVENGGRHESPWVDPLMAAWRTNDAGTWLRIDEDDDSGPDQMDALIDTGELPLTTPLCFVVTTYGDSLYTGGATQGSAGAYDLNVVYGNRGPTVAVSQGGTPIGSSVTINEGDILTFDLAYTDPENDTLTGSWSMAGASMAIATQGTFNTATGMSTFLWRAPQTAARDSPYALALRIADQEITRTVMVTVNVLPVNVAPSTPVPVSPADGGRVAQQIPQLVCRESYDEDEETLSYDYEVFYDDAGTASQLGNVVGVDGGWHPDAGPAPTVALIPQAIPENTRVSWHARAYDGHGDGGYSSWSALARFTVDTANDAPAAPILVKPAVGDTVLVLRPTLSAEPPLDPEGDAYSLFFEVAKDMNFTLSVGTSTPVAVAPGPTTMWTFDRDLEWGTQYFARAWAVDIRNGKSAYSNVNPFNVRANMPPGVPGFVFPMVETCQDGFAPEKPMHVQISPATDPEMDAISIQLRVFLFSEDPMTATPAFDQTRLQTPGVTEFDVSNVPVPKDLRHRFQARALDRYGASSWSDCVFTVGVEPVADAGGTGGGNGGAGGGSGGGGAKTKSGCGCGAGEGLFALLAVVLVARRRRLG